MKRKPKETPAQAARRIHAQLYKRPGSPVDKTSRAADVYAALRLEFPDAARGTLHAAAKRAAASPGASVMGRPPKPRLKTAAAVQRLVDAARAVVEFYDFQEHLMTPEVAALRSALPEASTTFDERTR